MRHLRKLIMLTIISALFSSACATKVVYIKEEPPVKIVEVKTAKPYPNAVWISGYWQWNAIKYKYVWISGYWVKPHKNKVWISGHWKKTRSGWIWKKGHWK